MKVSKEHTGTSRYVKVIVCFNKGQLKNLKHLGNETFCATALKNLGP